MVDQIMNMVTVAAEMVIENNNIGTKNSKTTRIIECESLIEKR